MNRNFVAAGLCIAFLSTICFGKDKVAGTGRLQYRLLATTKTSTMQKEINETAGSEMAMFLSLDGSVTEPYQYKLLATTRTGTMQKELNEVADAGYRLIPSTMIAKAQLFGGVEIVMILERPPIVKDRYEYKLLATSRTSTLQKEVTEAKDAGFIIVGMVSRGEHMVVMERRTDSPPKP